ncbi:major facilitator superfamily domain-containing protein 4A-like isoform X2 [Ptychodera flava]|uniref:major facilitator superfamily domain-containing protein 4A-like isoform X2 n=1 Tax=Ptychodera flava TaxID=63121 RepID=UPI00396AA4E8
MATSERDSDQGQSSGNEAAMEKTESSPVKSQPIDDGQPQVSAKELFQENLQATVTYCSVFWSFGMCVALLGPTLLDLGCLTSSPLETMSWVFFAQALSTLVGSMFGGVLVERLQADLILLVAISTIAITIAMLPFCHALWLLGIVLAIMGIAMGTIDTTANVCLIKIYGPLVSPFLQALHFCYGIGAFISPIIAEPFLLNEDCTPLIHPNVTNTSGNDVIIRAITEPSATEKPVTMETLEEAQERTRVRFAFWIMAFIQIPIICMVLALMIRKRCFSDSMDGQKKEKDKYQDIDKVTEATEIKTNTMKHEERRCCGSSSSKIIALTSLSALMLFIYDGLQAAYGGYVYTYSVKSVIDLSSTEGAYLTSVYWGSFALGRLLSIPISTKLSPSFMLFINIVGCFASYGVELILRHNHIAMYVGSATFGLFLSSVYPTVLALTEQFIDVTGSVTSAIVVGAATGEMIFPVVVGRIFVHVGPVSFLVFGNVACFVSVFVYLAICLLGRTTGKQQKARCTENTSLLSQEVMLAIKNKS